jgi:hypothetical protein
MVLAAFVSPALANEYWVQYDYSTHVCSVVEKKSADTAADTAQGPNATGGANVIAPNDTTPDPTQGADAANTTTEAGASGAPTAAPTPGFITQDAIDANNAATARAIAAYEAERNAARAAKAATTSGNTQGTDAATTTTEVSGSGAPNAATQGADAANTTTEVSGSGAPNATTTSSAQGANAAETTTKDRASSAPNAASTGAAPTGDTKYDPFKALAATWERKKAAAEAAGTDTTKALIGIALHSRQEAENEMQVMRKCGLRP